LEALRFVSISDEKVARVFEAPRAFITLTQALGVSIAAVDEVINPSKMENDSSYLFSVSDLLPPAYHH
jgi:hypothetical protein